jgi:hypothetical protein
VNEERLEPTQLREERRERPIEIMEKWLISGRRSHQQPARFQFNDQSVTALQISPKMTKPIGASGMSRMRSTAQRSQRKLEEKHER